MASWKDRLFADARFGSASFNVDTSEYSTGRRLAIHELPQSDEPVLEDRGLKTRKFRVRGFVIGDDYHDKLEALLSEVETQPTSGRLFQHPYLGVFLCKCTDLSVMHERREGRMAVVELELVRSHPHQIALRPAAPRQEALGAASELSDQAGVNLENGLAVDGVPESVRTSAADALTSAGTALRKLDVFSGVGREAANFARKVDTLLGQVTSLITAPANLVFQVRDALETVETAALNVPQAFASYGTLASLPSPVSLGGSSIDLAGLRNAQLVTNLFRQLAIAGQLRALPRMKWDYLEQALAARRRFLDATDAILGDVDDDSYQAIRRARAAAIAWMPAENVNLPRLADFQVLGETSALRLTYTLYGSLDREADLVARNRIRHPGFVPAGSTLEVLVDG